MDSNCSMEPCLRTGSRNSTFYVDLKGMAQNTWAHTHFLWKFAISDATDDFIWNIYINRTCISLFWIQAYQISYYRTILSKVNKMFTYFAFSGFWPPPPNFFYPTAFPSDEIWSLDQYLQNDTKNETFARIRNYWVSRPSTIVIHQEKIQLTFKFLEIQEEILSFKPLFEGS